MKIESITIQGFRGFNKERSIPFHPSLTLIYGPNSYGKTSISEAFEWLLYGVTSKVERADSKEEYRGSCRNRHLLEGMTPFVKVVFLMDNRRTEFCSELSEGDEAIRYVDGQQVSTWPFAEELPTAPRPFILQHALKYLLLAKPDERFKGFAKLLGLEELDEIQRNVVSLCTKPETCIPTEVKDFLSRVESLETQLATQSSLAAICDLYKRGDLSEFYRAVPIECKHRVPPNTPEESVLPQLLKIREDAVSKLFSERITLPDYSDSEKQTNTADYNFLLQFVSEELVRTYMDLIALTAIDHIIKRVQFYGLGIELLNQMPSKCPFCGQHIDKALLQHK
ncbi:AAA family ATPase [bacterium]|nr:AAA family ATPase [bacterium]